MPIAIVGGGAVLTSVTSTSPLCCTVNRCEFDPCGLSVLSNVSSARDMVTRCDPVRPPNVALTVAVPRAIALTRPVGETVATAVFEDPQTDCAVTSWLAPVARTAVAVNCAVVPVAEIAPVTVTARGTVTLADPITP